MRTLRRICSMRTPQASGHIFLKTSRNPEDGKRDPVFADSSQGIVAIGLGRIGRVQVNHVIGPVSRYLASNSLDQVSVGVDDGNAGTAGDVLERHCFEEGRFPSARFPIT